MLEFAALGAKVLAAKGLKTISPLYLGVVNSDRLLYSSFVSSTWYSTNPRSLSEKASP